MPRRKNLHHCSIIELLLTTDSASRETEDSSKLVFIVNVKTDKRQIWLRRSCDFDVAKVNTLLRPDGERQAYVQMASDYGALDVASRIGIIQTETSWLILNIYFFII